MNNPNSINDSTQIQLSKPQTNSISIESVESSILTLIKSWCRIRKWHIFFSPRDQNLNRASWRIQLVKFLESAPVHIIAILLIILDLIFTILELSSSLLSCTPKKNNIEKLVWYHWVGIAILSTLSAKTMALAVGLGSAFFRRPGYIIDGVVLMGALLLESFLEKKGGGLLVVVSLWRIVRVVESAFELSDEAIEAQIENIVCQFEALREENMRLLEIIAEKDKILQKLQQELDQCRHACDNSLTYIYRSEL